MERGRGNICIVGVETSIFWLVGWDGLLWLGSGWDGMGIRLLKVNKNGEDYFTIASHSIQLLNQLTCM